MANVPNTRLLIGGGDEGMLTVVQPLLDERIRVMGYLGGAGPHRHLKVLIAEFLAVGGAVMVDLRIGAHLDHC